MKDSGKSKVQIGALYGRVSDEESFDREHGSIEQQKHLGLQQTQFLTEATGIRHEIKYILIEDRAITGGHTNRPKYQELIDLIITRRVDFIVAKEISRLNRSVKDFCELMNLCKHHGVAVHIRGLNMDPRNPMHEAMFQMLAVIAELERKIIQERTRSSIRSAMLHNKKIPGGRLILGFDKVSAGFWKANEEEIQRVTFLMKTFNETMDYVEIRKIARQQGIKSKEGKHFTKNAIKRIVTNPKYIGKMSVPTDDGEELWVDLPHGPVVPVELFEETQRNVEFIENNPKNLRNKLRVYILKDLLRFEDGSKFRGKSGTGRLGDRYYYYRNETHQISIDAKEIEQTVMKSLRVYENDKTMVEYAGEIKSNVSTKLDLINRQIASVNAQLKKLDEDERQLPASFEAMRDGSDRLMAWLERQLKATEAQRQDLQNSLRCLEKERDHLALVSVDSRSLRNSLKAVFTRLEAAAPHLQRSILRQVFEKITVFRDNHLRIDWAPALRDNGGPEVAMRTEWGG